MRCMIRKIALPLPVIVVPPAVAGRMTIHSGSVAAYD
jgi:hypothetical protein